MKLNFNFPITDLGGKEIKENDSTLMMSRILSTTLVNPAVKIGDVMKRNSMAEKIYQIGELEVDVADLKLLKDIVNEKDIFAPRVQYLLIKYLDSIKE